MFTKYLQDLGIKHQLSASYAHQQNGKAEHVICTIEGCLFAMLEGAQLPANLWGKVVLTACYLWNCSTSYILSLHVTPYELVNYQQPDLAHIRVFGSYCFT